MLSPRAEIGVPVLLRETVMAMLALIRGDRAIRDIMRYGNRNAFRQAQDFFTAWQPAARTDLHHRLLDETSLGQ